MHPELSDVEFPIIISADKDASASVEIVITMAPPLYLLQNLHSPDNLIRKS